MVGCLRTRARSPACSALLRSAATLPAPVDQLDLLPARPPWRPSSSAPSLTPSSGKARHGKLSSLLFSPSSGAFLTSSSGVSLSLSMARPCCLDGLTGPPLHGCFLRSPPTCRRLGIREVPGAFLLKLVWILHGGPVPKMPQVNWFGPYRTTPSPCSSGEAFVAS